MSTVKTLRLKSTSSEETEQLGARLARMLKGGEVIELISDLGGGKTTFVRGLVRALNSEDRVASPTFTISKVYKTPVFEIHHFDFYRLANAGLAAYELHDLLGDPKVVVIVEWGEIVQHVLPEDRVSITINRDGETSREFLVRYTEAMDYIGAMA